MSQQPTVLVVEDEPAQREVLAYNLEAEGFRVAKAGNGEEALVLVDETMPDIIVLDWMLPNVSGIEVCRQLKMRSETRSVPIIMLSARSEEVDKVRGLETGADDYVVKPVSGPQLSARISALLRRGKGGTDDVLTVGGLEIRLGPREAELDSRLLELTAKEFDVLAYLAARPGQVVSKEDLHAAVWKAPTGTEGRTVDVHLSTIRKKLGEKPDDERRYLHTVIGAGVRLVDPGA